MLRQITFTLISDLIRSFKVSICLLHPACSGSYARNFQVADQWRILKVNKLVHCLPFIHSSLRGRLSQLMIYSMAYVVNAHDWKKKDRHIQSTINWHPHNFSFPLLVGHQEICSRQNDFFWCFLKQIICALLLARRPSHLIVLSLLFFFRRYRRSPPAEGQTYVMRQAHHCQGEKKIMIFFIARNLLLPAKRVSNRQ